MNLTVCDCERTHPVFPHAACYRAEEHVCSPCECDCHYEDVEANAALTALPLAVFP